MRRIPSKRITRPASAERVEGDGLDLGTKVFLSLLFGSSVAAIAAIAALLFFGNTCSRVLIVAMLVLFGLYATVSIIRSERRWKRLAADREGESICTFVRSFNYRSLDTCVLRAVYEAVGELIYARVPIRPNDRFYETLEITDGMDLNELACECADRSRRSMDCAEQNPYFGRVDTVEDLVHFLHHQPRVAEAA